MHKKILPALILGILVLFTTFVYAADEYSFSLDYEGEVIAGEAKTANVKLSGNNAPTYTNVRIKVDIQGPSTPKLLATDSAGNQYDIAQLGYWGPDAGFAVQGTFTNVTPVTATFDKAGQYTITLSLIDVSANNAVITSREIGVTVKDKAATDNTIQNTIGNTVQNTVQNTVANTVANTVTNNVLNNVVSNTINKIPQTGAGMFDYSLCFAVTALTIVVGYIIIRNGRQN